MYKINDEIREIFYSGGADYKAKVLINGTEINQNKIEKITILNPFFDNTSQTFYLGQFISQKVEIYFNDINEISTTGNVEISIGVRKDTDNNEYTYIPIGKYIIDSSNEDYYNNKKIVCLDYAIKMKTNVDYSNLIIDSSGNITPISIEELLQWLCNYFGIELGTYPDTNKDYLISTYDNTLSGKYYVSLIAELMGGNAVIDRYGKLNIIPIKQEPVVTRNATKNESWEYYNKYIISGVKYDNGTLYKFSGNDTNNVLYIRSNNMFVLDNYETLIENIYNAVKDTTICSLKTKQPCDLSLDRWDLIGYDVDGVKYLTYNNNNITYEMSIVSEINTQIPTKVQEITTNFIETNDKEKIRKIEYEVNQEKLSIKKIIKEIGDREEKETSITEDIDGITSQISKLAKISTENSGIGTVYLENLMKSKIIYLEVHPTKTDLKSIKAGYIKAGKDIYASSVLITFDGDEDYRYVLPCDLLQLNGVYDEFIQDNVNKSCYVIKRIGLDEDGNKYILDNEIITHYDLTYYIGNGNNYIYLNNYPDAYINVRAMVINDMTTQLATEVQFENLIKQTANAINLSVDEFIDGQKLTGARIILEINEDRSGIKLNADSIDLSGYTSINKSFVINEEGQMFVDNKVYGLYDYNLFDANICFAAIKGFIQLTNSLFNVLDANNRNEVTLAELARIYNVARGNVQNIHSVKCKFEINSNNPKNCVLIKDENDNIIVSLGIGGINSETLIGKNIIAGDYDSADYVNGVYINGSTQNIKLYNQNTNSDTNINVGTAEFTGEDNNKTQINGGNLSCSSLTVTGSKNRAVQIDDGSYVLQNAYETCTPYFGDLGSGITDKNGECKIEIDSKFLQTIEIDTYKVFVQELGEGKLYVEKQKEYFLVKGTPYLEFDYEIKAIQKGFKDTRLKVWELPNDKEE